MTTFTMQDLTINNLPTTPEEDEAMDALAKLGGGVALSEMFAGMGKDLTAQHAPVPQPTPIATDVANIGGIIDSICTQLHLLGTVISQSKAQPEGAQESLQETVKLVLQQGDWFKEMVAQHLKDMGVDDIAESVVENLVERDVENYFSNSFDPTDHFDFGDAVSNEVDDRLDDVVRDNLDDVVQEQLEEVVAEKLKSIRVVFD